MVHVPYKYLLFGYIVVIPFCPSVRPSVRKKSLSLELRLHFKDLRNDTLGSHWVCLVDAQ